MSQNPYAPPSASLAVDPTPSRVSLLGRSVIPAIITVVFMLVLWVAAVSVLDRLANGRTGIIVWSISLYFSTAVSTTTVNYFWRSRTFPFAFGCAFAVFSLVFCLLEGDTSNGTDVFQASVVYGTLITIPVFAYALACLPHCERLQTAVQKSERSE